MDNIGLEQHLSGMGLSDVTLEQVSELEWKLGEMDVSNDEVWCFPAPWF